MGVMQLHQQFKEKPVQDFDWNQNVVTKFGDDDDESLHVSVYAGGGESILTDVAAVLREYGFTRFGEVDFAPGTYVFSFEVKFGKSDSGAARRSKSELKRDLLKRRSSVRAPRPTKESKRASALAKLWKKIRKGSVYVLIGTTLLWGTKEVGTVVTEELIRDNAPAIVKRVDNVVVREFPPRAAAKLHAVFQKYIDDSSQKQTLPPPTPPPPKQTPP
jgi:hypothetical protein